MRWFENMAGAEARRIEERLGSKGPELERKYWIALALYVVLAVLAWFTIGEGTVPAFGRQIEIRWIPVFVLATFAFRTWVAMQADRIRRSSK